MMYIGCDIVEIRRIKKAMQNASFLRVLTVKELALYNQLKGHRAMEWLAGRFAAKEAIYKAVHKVYPCVISKIEVLADEDGAPICHLPNLEVQISIAHELRYAVAFASVVSEEISQ